MYITNNSNNKHFDSHQTIQSYYGGKPEKQVFTKYIINPFARELYIMAFIFQILRNVIVDFVYK